MTNRRAKSVILNDRKGLESRGSEGRGQRGEERNQQASGNKDSLAPCYIGSRSICASEGLQKLQAVDTHVRQN